MSESIHAIINISMLGTTLIFSLILLCACMFKKSKSLLDKPFTCMVAITVLMQCTGIMAWFYDLVNYSPLLYRITLAIDYIVVYLVSISFMWYLYTLLHSIGHPDSNVLPALNPIVKRIILIVSMVNMSLYLCSYWTGWFFTFDEHGVIQYTGYMLICQALSSIWQVFDLYIILKNRRKLGIARFSLLSAYVLLPTCVFLLDLSNSVSLGYVVFAAVTMLLYVHINMDSERRMMAYQTKLAHKEAEMSETKMELMLMQIQPHFLYNALSTISYLCTHDPRDARQAVNEFSSYLKGNMESINTKAPVPFDTELAHVQNYLALEKRRFPTRLMVEYEIGPRNFMIPTLTLQTLVENAVRHGVGARYEPTTVHIQTSESLRHWIVRVADDGIGFDVAQLPDDGRQHIGLAGAKYRIQQMMGGEVQINSIIGKGTEVTILIPKEAQP